MSPSRFVIMLVALTVVALTAPHQAAAFYQDDPPKPKQGDDKKATDKKTDDKKAGDKKADIKRIKISVKVSTADGKPIPTNTMVEISGQETACGSLNVQDKRQKIENGEAVFTDMPACKVTVKIDLSLYKLVRRQVDLASYNTPISLTLDPLQ